MGKIEKILWVILLSGCSKDCLVISKPVPVLENSYPLWYGPRSPNRIVKWLQPGKYEYVRFRYGKDFVVYTIDIGSTKGYVILDEGVSQCQMRSSN